MAAGPKDPLVYVVDDQPSICRGLTRLIGSVGFKVQTFPTANDFLLASPHEGPCCLILDLYLPGINGLELQELLLEKQRLLPIIFITGFGEVSTSVRAMKSGAVDFLQKPIDDSQLLAAVQTALATSKRERDQHQRVSEIRERAKRLTNRETQVFALVVTGLLNKQIAGELGISEKTVKVHRARVMRKMEAGSVPDLVVFSSLMN